MAAVTICSDFGAPQNKVWHCFHCFPIYFPWPDAMIFVFWMLSFKPAFSLSSFTFVKRLFSSSSLSAIRGSNTTLTLCKIGTSKPREVDFTLGLQRVWCICDGGESHCHRSCLLSHLLPLQETWVFLTAPLVVVSRNASIPKPRSLKASFGMKWVLSIP